MSAASTTQFCLICGRQGERYVSLCPCCFYPKEVNRWWKDRWLEAAVEPEVYSRAESLPRDLYLPQRDEREELQQEFR